MHDKASMCDVHACLHSITRISLCDTNIFVILFPYFTETLLYAHILIQISRNENVLENKLVICICYVAML